MTPLRIGILGAARIADDGIIDPSKVLGHRVVAVAARDRGRAEAFAAERGITRVHDDYAGVIADPEVDVVYNALVNSLHAEWNIAALRAGKFVLSEKPLASNAIETRAVRDVARKTGSTIVEGFHYLHHPVNIALRDLVTSGELGAIQRVEIVLAIPGPPDSDPRWSLELAGGATMDLGCYVLSAARHFGHWIGAAPAIVGVQSKLRSPEVDSAMRVELAYAGGVAGHLRWDMAAQERTMTWTVIGADGTATSPAFAVPHMDNRLLVSRNGAATAEPHGDQTSYTYQLANVARTLQTGEKFLVDIDDAVANADLIDECYRRAGLTPRGQRG